MLAWQRQSYNGPASRTIGDPYSAPVRLGNSVASLTASSVAAKPIAAAHIEAGVVARPRIVTSGKETERFKSFAYVDLLKRDKVSVDIFWLKDESLEDSANLPVPDVIAAEIAEDLQAALDQFTLIAADLRK
jgi:type I restriction enzyme M protein